MKRVIAWATLIGLCPVLLTCAAPAEPGTGEGAGSFSVTRDIAYGDDPEQRLDLYLQGSRVGESFRRAPDPRPTLLFIHGGGWLRRDSRPESLILPFVEQGWHALGMTYRLGPGTAPAAVDDGVCALGWVVRNADRFGFDLEKIVVTGLSAGGHLSLTSGILGSRPGHECSPGNGFRVHSVINWYGITDIEAVESFLAVSNPDSNYALAWIGGESRVTEISAGYSPVHLVGADSPPVLTIHGTDDSVVPHDQAVVLHGRLDELGIRNRLLSVPGGTHGGFTDAQFQQAFAAAFAFVDTR